MKLKPIHLLGILILVWLFFAVVLKSGFYPRNCTCSYQFVLVSSNAGMDCARYCDEFKEATVFEQIVNKLLLRGFF